MSMFSAKNRSKYLNELVQQEFDVLVIGGGITGAGIALDAAVRGLKVALVEMQDFASGTSSRSTKLVHGGLRYLKQFEFRLVAEVGQERETVHRNAPHLTKPEPMLLPIVEGGSMGMLAARFGMTVYEWLAGVKQEEYHKVLSKEETLKREPCMKAEGLLGSILFYEYRTDDARLTMEVLKTAVSRGALALNYTKANAFLYEGEQICGAIVQDSFSGQEYTIKAKYVVNAAGPWVDEVDDLEPKHGRHKLSLTKGVHLVFDFKRLPIHQAVYFDTYDKRMIFVIPRDGKTYVGTTDTFHNQDFIEPNVTIEDRDYLLKCVNDFFPSCALTAKDVESCWSGVRPLVTKPGKGPSEISRKDEMFVSESGLITIAGGKLTGYRKMSQRVTDLIAQKMKGKVSKCTTTEVVISGGLLDKKVSFSDFVQQTTNQLQQNGMSAPEAKKLSMRYGVNVHQVLAYLTSLPKDIATDVPEILRAECLYALHHEMCSSLSDFLIRRTGMMFFEIDNALRYKAGLNQLIAHVLEYDATQEQQSLLDFERLVKIPLSVRGV